MLASLLSSQGLGGRRQHGLYRGKADAKPGAETSSETPEGQWATSMAAGFMPG